MFTIVLFMYLQSNLDVMLVKTRASGQFRTRAACEAAALLKRCPLPVPEGFAAAWQDAACMPVNRGVIVVTNPAADLPNLADPDPPLPGCKREQPARGQRGHGK